MHHRLLARAVVHAQEARDVVLERRRGSAVGSAVTASGYGSGRRCATSVDEATPSSTPSNKPIMRLRISAATITALAGRCLEWDASNIAAPDSLVLRLANPITMTGHALRRRRRPLDARVAPVDGMSAQPR